MSFNSKCSAHQSVIPLSVIFLGPSPSHEHYECPFQSLLRESPLGCSPLCRAAFTGTHFWDLKKHTGPPVRKAPMLNFQFYGCHLEIRKHLWMRNSTFSYFSWSCSHARKKKKLALHFTLVTGANWTKYLTVRKHKWPFFLMFLQETFPMSFHLLRLKMYFKYIRFIDLPIARNKIAIMDLLI